MKTVRDTGKYHVIEASISVTNSEYLLQMQLFSKSVLKRGRLSGAQVI